MAKRRKMTNWIFEWLLLEMATQLLATAANDRFPPDPKEAQARLRLAAVMQVRSGQRRLSSDKTALLYASVKVAIGPLGLAYSG